MDHAVNIDGEQGAAARLALPDDVIAMIGRLIEYAAGRVMAARRAIQCAALDALRAIVSQIALMLILAVRLIVRWAGVSAFEVRQAGARAERHLHHPPQAWAAP